MLAVSPLRAEEAMIRSGGLAEVGHMQSVYQKHSKEIVRYQEKYGYTNGLLAYANAILSDVIEMVSNGTSKERIVEEINEAKELILDAIRRTENLVVNNSLWFIKKAIDTLKTNIRYVISDMEQLNFGMARENLETAIRTFEFDVKEKIEQIERQFEGD